MPPCVTVSSICDRGHVLQEIPSSAASDSPVPQLVDLLPDLMPRGSKMGHLIYI